MQTFGKAITILTIIGIIFGFTTLTFAGGAGAGEPSCIVDKKMGTALRTTVAVEYDPTATGPDGDGVVDATIRAERGKLQKFYRVTISGTDITADTDEVIFCKLFNPDSWPDTSQNYASILDVVNDIFLDFFEVIPTPPNDAAGQLVITNKSISDTDVIIDGDASIRQIPGTSRFMSIAEVTAYAVFF